MLFGPGASSKRVPHKESLPGEAAELVRSRLPQRPSPGLKGPPSPHKREREFLLGSPGANDEVQISIKFENSLSCGERVAEGRVRGPEPTAIDYI
jgi:hypothetical protein